MRYQLTPGRPGEPYFEIGGMVSVDELMGRDPLRLLKRMNEKKKPKKGTEDNGE